MPRSRLAAIVESSHDAIVSEALDGTITSWNKGAERIYGYTAAEAIGQPTSMLVPLDRHDEVPELLERIGRGEHVEHYETLRLTKDGERIDVSLTISPIKNADETISEASVVARDVSERKRTEEQLERVASELARSNRELEEFARVASHDLQEPLRKIQTFGDRLKVEHGDALGSQGRDYLERMEDAAQRMQALIESLLALSRLTRRRQPLNQLTLAS
jgi:PAS domain S-box-containing protein